MDNENIKQAIDSFESEDYVTSKNLLQKEIQKAKEDWLTRKLNLHTPYKKEQ